MSSWSAPRYRKEMNQPLNFSECVKLLRTCVEHGVITRDPKDTDDSQGCNIMVYISSKSENFPEGWYSRPLSEVAQELLPDIEGQRTLRKVLEEKGVDLVFREFFPPKEGEGVGRNYIDER